MISQPRISVIIPAYDRAEKLVRTLSCLRRQELDPGDYEVIIVDNGSAVPFRLPSLVEGMNCSLIRIEVNQERCVARNRGASAAHADILLFMDDDMGVEPHFLLAHLRAHEEWPGALAVGAVTLPLEQLQQPFVRFRQDLEQTGVPSARGPIALRTFCTGQNMSIHQRRFEELSGFDGCMVGFEDQDFAMRHTVAGGKIVFLPEALAVHHDHCMDIRSYCRRQEWASECTVLFRLRFPDWPDCVKRDQVNGPARYGQPIRKLLKQALLWPPALALLFGLTGWVERVAPGSRSLPRLYRLLLGLHLLRGYRSGLERYTEADVRLRPAAPSSPVGV